MYLRTLKLGVLGMFFGLSAVTFGKSPALAAADDWKGGPRSGSLNVSGLGGLGFYGTRVGGSLNGRVAFKIVHHGFIPDINNQVFAELGLGPTLIPEGTLFNYAAHLRWDFHLNEMWTFYATGGLGGVITGEKLGNVWQMTPRFGVGLFYRLADPISLRAEVAHDLVLAGVSFEF